MPEPHKTHEGHPHGLEIADARRSAPARSPPIYKDAARRRPGAPQPLLNLLLSTICRPPGRRPRAGDLEAARVKPPLRRNEAL